MIAMIFAAGLGERLKPFTIDKPKALVEYKGIPLIDYSIEKLKRFGVTKLIVNVHHHAGMLRDYLTTKNFGIEILISDEQDFLLDTGGGLKKAMELIPDYDGDVILHNVDIVSDIDLAAMLEFHRSQEADVTLAVSKRNTARYLLFDHRMKLIGWVNEKDFDIKYPGPNKWPENKLAFSGVHIVSKRYATSLKKEGKFSIIDAYLSTLCGTRIYGFEHSAVHWKDLGKIEDFI